MPVMSVEKKGGKKNPSSFRKALMECGTITENYDIIARGGQRTPVTKERTAAYNIPNKSLQATKNSARSQ